MSLIIWQVVNQSTGRRNTREADTVSYLASQHSFVVAEGHNHEHS